MLEKPTNSAALKVFVMASVASMYVMMWSSMRLSPLLSRTADGHGSTNISVSYVSAVTDGMTDPTVALIVKT